MKNGQKPTTLFLILGTHLYPELPEGETSNDCVYVMIESWDLCERFRFHRHKILFFLSAMRSYRDRLESSGYLVDYTTLVPDSRGRDFTEQLKLTLQRYPEVCRLKVYEPEDHFMREKLQDLGSEHGIETHFQTSPGFYLSRDQALKDLPGNKKPFLNRFYIQQRKRFKILLESGENPVGGDWNYDAANRKKLPRKHISPQIRFPEWTRHTRELEDFVQSNFDGHPGDTDNFCWPTTRDQALEWMTDFLDQRLDLFGPYEDAFEKDEVWIYHSALSPLINAGLLTPREVVEGALDRYERGEARLESVEGLVRQILGWREFIRAVYHAFPNAWGKNPMNHQRRLTEDWWRGTTGLPPVDAAILRVQRWGYTHHIERLMVLGNIMLLSEVHPDEVYRWFMEMYIDSLDWVMAPNVYGMSQYADGGLFATKPYIGASNYWGKMSHYTKDSEWTEIVDGLYWRFVEKRRELFESNHRMAMMTKTLDRMNPEKKQRIFKKAEKFIGEKTRSI